MKLAMACAILLVAGMAPATAQFGRGTDFTGVWKVEMAGGDAKAETLLNLKMKGKELTGTLKTPHGEFAIANGSADGQDLFFNVVIKREEYELKTTYRGHLYADEIQFTVEAGERMLLAIARKET
jgi:hypothetical protein